jgi:hypothetical protein
MNVFKNQEKFSQSMRTKFLDRFYRKASYEGKFQYFDGDSMVDQFFQCHLHCDTLAKTGPKDFLLIDEKIQKSSWGTFLLETKQSTITNKPGWMFSTGSDVILYAFCLYGERAEIIGLNTYLLNVRLLKLWFEKNAHRYERRIGMHQPNKPEFILVPIEDIEELIIFNVKIFEKNFEIIKNNSVAEKSA